MYYRKAHICIFAKIKDLLVNEAKNNGILDMLFKKVAVTVLIFF